MKSVVVLDYGSGNVRSVAQALTHAAQDSAWAVRISREPAHILQADRLVLPGQGAMPHCMGQLHATGAHDVLMEYVQRERPLLGICVGMQMLLDSSSEGPCAGLGLIPGVVSRFDLQAMRQSDGAPYKVPQMGWNRVWHNLDGKGDPHPLWQGITDGSYFYFVPSFYAQVQSDKHVAAHTEYGHRFVSAVCRANIFATQFHPEKSAEQGLALYRNFLNWSIERV